MTVAIMLPPGVWGFAGLDCLACYSNRRCCLDCRCRYRCCGCRYRCWRCHRRWPALLRGHGGSHRIRRACDLPSVLRRRRHRVRMTGRLRQNPQPIASACRASSYSGTRARRYPSIAAQSSDSHGSGSSVSAKRSRAKFRKPSSSNTPVTPLIKDCGYSCGSQGTKSGCASSGVLSLNAC